MRRATLLLVAVVAAVVLASGIALAAQSGTANASAHSNSFPSGVSTEAAVPARFEATTTSKSGTFQHFVAAAASTSAQWLDGVSQDQGGYNCITSQNETMISSQTGYYGTTDVSFPKVGDVYYAHLVLGIGNPCSGALAVTTGVDLPHDTAFAVSPTNKIHCLYKSPTSSSWQEATNDPGMDCVQNPALKLPDGSWDLGTRALPHYSMVEIRFPLKSTQELKGAAGPSGGDRLVGHVESLIVNPLVARPSAWVAVPGSGTPGGGGGGTTDIIKPTFTPVQPAAGATGVSRGINVVGTFSEKMDKSTLAKTTFKLYKVTATGPHRITNVKVRPNLNGTKAKLNPYGSSTRRLAKHTKYKAVVTTGVKDLAGNAMATKKVWYFKTVN